MVVIVFNDLRRQVNVCFADFWLLSISLLNNATPFPVVENEEITGREGNYNPTAYDENLERCLNMTLVTILCI